MPHSNLEILACEPSPLGAALFTTTGVACATRHNCDGSDFESRVSDEQPVYRFGACVGANRVANARLATNLRVLVGGLGLGYTAWQALRPTASQGRGRGIVAASDRLAAGRFSATVVGTVRRAAVASHARATSTGVLAEPPDELFDLILIDVDHSPDERLAPVERCVLLPRKVCRLPGNIWQPTASWQCGPTLESSPFADALARGFRASPRRTRYL